MKEENNPLFKERYKDEIALRERFAEEYWPEFKKIYKDFDEAFEAWYSCGYTENMD